MTVILKLIRNNASSLESITTLDTIVVDKNAVNSAMNSISINDKAKIDTLVVVSVSMKVAVVVVAIVVVIVVIVVVIVILVVVAIV